MFLHCGNLEHPQKSLPARAPVPAVRLIIGAPHSEQARESTYLFDEAVTMILGAKGPLARRDRHRGAAEAEAGGIEGRDYPMENPF
jgi:hypothetical protein